TAVARTSSSAAYAAAPTIPSAARAIACPWRRHTRRPLIRASGLVEVLGDRFPVVALVERDLGHGVPVLQARKDAHRPVAPIRVGGLEYRLVERELGLRHRLALGLGRLEVLAARDRLRLP